MATVNYIPHEDEEFMSERQISWFRRRLESIGEALNLIPEGNLGVEGIFVPETAPDGYTLEDWAVEVKTQALRRRLKSRVLHSLERISEGEYGYCDMTGEEIPLKRLLANPTANVIVSVEEELNRKPKIRR